MFREYAVEPNCLDSPDALIYFCEKFGYRHGRLICRFPGKWARMVKNGFHHLPDGLTKSKMLNRLERIEKHLLDRKCCYDGNISWLENAESHHSLEPFDAIIALGNPRKHPQVLQYEERDEEHTLLKINRTPRVRRTANDMALAVRWPLQHGKTLVFVDPYFQNCNERHLRTLKEFVRTACQRDFSLFPLQKVVYHTGNATPDTHIDYYLQRDIVPIIKRGVTFEIVRWDDDELHNRLVITESCSVEFGIGLDDDDQGKGIAFDDISFFDSEAHEQKVNEFLKSKKQAALSYT